MPTATAMALALERTLAPTRDNSEHELAPPRQAPPALVELHDQIREVRQQLGALDDLAARRARRTERVTNLRLELARAEEQAAAARLAAEGTARGLAAWILRREPAPDGSLAERQEDAERATQRLRGLREQLKVAERKLADTLPPSPPANADADAPAPPATPAAGSELRADAAAAAARLRQLLERRLELLHALPDVPDDVRREAAYELAVCIRRGVGWLERVCGALEEARRYVANIASACAPRPSVLGARPPRRTPSGVEEDYLEAQRLYRAAAVAADGAQRELGLLLGVPHRSPAFEELEAALAHPRDASEVANLAAWELGHRLSEARALAEQYGPRLRELDDLASGGSR
jgi:hypothetical protein